MSSAITKQPDSDIVVSESGEQELQLVTFRCGNEAFAVDTLKLLASESV